MKKCSYCGLENDDEAVHCKECGTAFKVPDTEPLRSKLRSGLLAFRDSYRQGFGRRLPIFGTIAVTAPLWGFLLGLLIVLPPDSHDWGAAITLAGIILLASMLGAASALIALLRGERYRALGLIGLAVDLGPLLWAISEGQLRMSSGVILVLGFGPSLLGLLLLLTTCFVTRNRLWLGVACAVAMLLHGISAGLARKLQNGAMHFTQVRTPIWANPARLCGVTGVICIGTLYIWTRLAGRQHIGRALLGDLLIIGWAVIGVIALTKYALIEHAQTHR